MKAIMIISAAFIIAVLTGCDDGPSPRPHVETPQLEGFYVVDSEGVSSEFASDRPMIIDPYLNNGLFEVYWYARSFYDYNAYLSINDQPGVRGALLVQDDRCGIDLQCDEDGWYMCEYTDDYYLGCGLDLGEIERNYVDIYDLFVQVPDTLFLNLEICDVNDQHCQVQSVPVYMQ